MAEVCARPQAPLGALVHAHSLLSFHYLCDKPKRGTNSMEATSGENINQVLPVELLSVILNEHLDRDYDDVCAESACRLWADLLADARLHRQRRGKWFADMAAVNGHLNVLKWARANGRPWGTLTTGFAARYGHFDMLRWLHANGCPWNEWTCFARPNMGTSTMLKMGARQRLPVGHRDLCARRQARPL
ncbi:ankyrin repeat protein [Pandoravirus inopinatum]|uniref:Ankyrin repeat protein n=1 Tax=Pandoravirus inopinatum TaxID=1605721 RepID=A0A0B5IXB4_9VIRU|nr:ankyrin repeat protein [Pandoravirus inopinatum]AJF97388.1 ankyrin repeat protein [Pandoravirus inopinatum]